MPRFIHKSNNAQVCEERQSVCCIALLGLWSPDEPLLSVEDYSRDGGTASFRSSGRVLRDVAAACEAARIIG